MAGRPREDVIERFCRYVEVTDDCWVWTGSKNQAGYGKFVPIRGTTTPAHRWAYKTFVGPVADSMHVDHLCGNRACVNLDHLEPVTPRENTLRSSNFIAVNARKTHCVHGHEFTEKNTYRHPDRGSRHCRACMGKPR